MKKSVKKRLSKRKSSRKSYKNKQSGRGRLNNNSMNTYLPIVNDFIKKNNSFLKTRKNLEFIKTRVLDKGIVYDFIFKFNYETNKYIFEMIWEHGTKQKLEEITAGKPGLHVYVQKIDKEIKLLGIIKTQS